MTADDTRLQDLKHSHPEWEPWLGIVQPVLRETADPKWAAVVPELPAIQADKIPLLGRARIVLDKTLLHVWFEQLIRIAHRSGTDKLSSLRPVLDANVDICAVFEAALQQNDDFLKNLAASLDIDAEAFQAVTALLPVPLLQACNRRRSNAVTTSWVEGYCPVCGAWPAFAEMRGIERSRYFRCVRCGSEWQAHVLSCPYCGNTDHETLASLVAENSAKSAIDACKVCLGYVKVFTRLQGSSPDAVILEDLGSVEMDLAAADQGYHRPKGIGYRITPSLSVS